MSTRATWLASSLVLWTFLPTVEAGTATVTGTQQWVVNGANGPSLQSRTVDGVGPGDGGPNAATQTGAVWSFLSGVEGWTPQVVSIGNGGTEPFTKVGTFNSYSRVF